MPTLKSFDGLSLHYEIDPAEDCRAAAVVVHGFGDHCGRYKEFAQWLNSWGITCYRFDYRGHGRSEGKRGHCMQFTDYLKDLSCLVEKVQQDDLHQTKFLMGHSHGGLVVLHSLVEQQSLWTAAVLSSPFFGIQVQVPLWKRFLGNKLSKWLPTFQMPTDIDGSTVSHDETVREDYNNDPLIGRVASARWFTEAIATHERSPQAASQIYTPTLVQAAGIDHLVSLEATQRVYESLASPQQKMIVYDDLFHEIWFEKDRQKVLQDLQDFLSSFLE